MNYGDHNFIEITQQTKLRVEPVELDFVEPVDRLARQSRARRTSRVSRARRVERVELCCSTMSTQPKCMGSTRRTCLVEPSGIWALVGNRICCVCNFYRMAFFITFDAFWFCEGFLTRSVSVTCMLSCMNLLQHIKYYQFSYVFGTAQQHQFLFYNTGTIGVP